MQETNDRQEELVASVRRFIREDVQHGAAMAQPLSSEEENALSALIAACLDCVTLRERDTLSLGRYRALQSKNARVEAQVTALLNEQAVADVTIIQGKLWNLCETLGIARGNFAAFIECARGEYASLNGGVISADALQSAGGGYNGSTRTLVLRPDIEGTKYALMILAHEMTHACLDDCNLLIMLPFGSLALRQCVEEVSAETGSYFICHALGHAAVEYSAAYLMQYYENDLSNPFEFANDRFCQAVSRGILAARLVTNAYRNDESYFPSNLLPGSDPYTHDGLLGFIDSLLKEWHDTPLERAS